MITQNVKTRQIGFSFRKNVWMEKIGLEIGGKVQIIATEGRIIIEKL